MKPTKKYNLLVVAHPDDETIFAGGLLQVYRRRPWKVICVTDGNADGQGEIRRQDFLTACRAFKVRDAEMWDFPDRFNTRLDVDLLTARLKKEDPVEVFTHGILGEYGHPHHQDVCLAAHRVFAKDHIIWNFAYNCFAEKTFRIPRTAFSKKSEVLSRTYFSQTNKFARWLPPQTFEGFTKVSLSEVEALYGFFARGEPLPKSALKVYSWFEPYLENFRQDIGNRPF